jgi:hypothetical protein
MTDREDLEGGVGLSSHTQTFRLLRCRDGREEVRLVRHPIRGVSCRLLLQKHGPVKE